MQIKELWFDKENVFIRTDAGHIVGNPLSWFPKLANASQAQREKFELSPFGVHWEELDEDLRLDGFFKL